MEDVAYVPELTTNLFSVIYIRRKVLHVTFKSDKTDTGIVVVTEKYSRSIFMKGMKWKFGLHEMQLDTHFGYRLEGQV